MNYVVDQDISPSGEEELKDYPVFLRKLLYKRGVTTKRDAEVFLNPDWDRDSHDPFLMLNMAKAVERIFSAMEKKEHIIIYGDYDADGIPGSVVLHDFFKKIGYEYFGNYIPDRHREGYGLHKEAIDGFKQNGVTLLITVDCGISDVEEVSYAEKEGINVIITDHHLTQETIPPAYAILNSKQADDSYPDDMLCGAGVAFKLVQALLVEGRKRGVFDIPLGWEKWLLDMAGLSTIADMVPLVKENRTLAFFGLKVLRKSRRPGLKKLLQKMRVNQVQLTEDDVGFMIAPRINAASRMDIPLEAFRLLATNDNNVAEELSEHLHAINETRKGLVASMVKEARKKIEERDVQDVIVVGSPKWRPGVLGLVASRLVDDYGKSVFVWGRGDGDCIKGSCRSNGEVNVVELMSRISSDFFIDIGGHEFSGGFSISHENIHTLEEKILFSYTQIQRKEIEQEVCVDEELLLEDVRWENYAYIERLAPFGVGNPKPIFLFKNLIVHQVKHFGKEKNHLELVFKKKDGSTISAIGFFLQHDSFCDQEIVEGSVLNLVASFEKSVFRKKELRLRIVDILM